MSNKPLERDICELKSDTAQYFPFVIHASDSSETITSRRALLSDVPEEDFVRVHEGQFWNVNRRLRFWGFNICFGANFPTHEESDELAPHLAKLGVNALRFHHMDNRESPNGIWAKELDDGVRRFDPEMVDRLDYFLAKLHENGIYANLGLHVSRTLTEEEGFSEATDLPWWAAFNRWIIYFDERVQERVLEFSRELLTHKNPYRSGRARVDDPGIAIVEMMNENYFSKKGCGLFRRLPPCYQQSFLKCWNEWLSNKYSDDSSMRRSWSDQHVPPGDSLFKAETWARSAGDWQVLGKAHGMRVHFGNDCPIASEGYGAIRLELARATELDHVQRLGHANISTQKGIPITVSYKVRSDRPRTHRVEVSSSHGGQWRDLGLFETVDSTDQWKTVEFVFIPEETIDSKAGIALSFGNDDSPIEFSEVRVRIGSTEQSIPANQSITKKNIEFPESNWPLGAHIDMTSFMQDTEAAWIRKFREFLVDELDVKVPILAGQVNYLDESTVETLSDICDIHCYWNHPLFPSGKDWNPRRWIVGNDPIEAEPFQSDWPKKSLLKRCSWRIDGMPTTLSEWNFSEPSFCSSGCIPIAAILASLQDWDGVFFFDYDSFTRRDEVDESPFFRSHFNNFFSFCGQPVKLATFSMFANLFLREDLPPLKNSLIKKVGEPLSGRAALKAKVGASTRAEPLGHHHGGGADNCLTTEDNVFRWDFDGVNGTMKLATERTRGLWGTISNVEYQLPGLWFRVGPLTLNYGTLVLSSWDDQPLEKSQSMLLLAVSHARNVDMSWNETHDSVGKEWGRGPTEICKFDLDVRLFGFPQLECFALDERGERKTQVDILHARGEQHLALGRDYETIWYELTPS